MRGNPVRKSVIYGAAGAVVVVAAILVLVLAATQDRVQWPADGVGTFLWALRGSPPEGSDVQLLGIVAFTSSRVTMITIPPDVSVKGRDGELIEIRRLGEADGWKSCCAAVGALVGVDVAGYVVADCTDAATYCDAIGPIAVDNPAPVSYLGASSVAAGIEIGRGRQNLTGAEVIAYVAGTSSEGQAERCERVARSAVAAAAARSRRSGAPPLRLTTNLNSGQLEQVWQSLSRSSGDLAVREILTALIVRDGATRRVPRVVETEKLVSSLLRSEDLLTPDDISVAVFNGNGARLAATQAAEYLEARGFRVPRIGNADSFDYATTTIVRLTDESRAWILRESLPGASRITTPAEFGAHYEALRPLVPAGTDLVLVVGAGMEWNQ